MLALRNLQKVYKLYTTNKSVNQINASLGVFSSFIQFRFVFFHIFVDSFFFQVLYLIPHLLTTCYSLIILKFYWHLHFLLQSFQFLTFPYGIFTSMLDCFFGTFLSFCQSVSYLFFSFLTFFYYKLFIFISTLRYFHAFSYIFVF